MSKLIVTAYNLGFGDTLLLTVPEQQRGKKTTRHILIDFGNVLGRFENEGQAYRDVAEDILRRLDGRPIDLYIMTHEHMDHVRGLKYISGLNMTLPISYSWLTASSHPTYYKRYPKAHQRGKAYREEYTRLKMAIDSQGLAAAEPALAFLEINNPASTAECVECIRQTAARRTAYVHREFELTPGQYHPFREARLSIWGPEADASAYYGRFRPLAVPAVRVLSGQPTAPKAPKGIDPVGFRKLLEFLETGFTDNMLAIDRAANNTSIVFLLEWRGWKLLFPGDADYKSWALIERYHLLQPVHFLKLSHHASRNGTPPDEIMDQLLPPVRTDLRSRSALVSTYPGVYGGVPDRHTIDRIKERVDLMVNTHDVAIGRYVEVIFEG